MKEYKLYQIDAFTLERYAGNPCAVVLDADDLTTDQMQKIAKEMNLSETAFVIESERADFGARYFTPAEEIPMAGHPTISTIKTLIEVGRVELTDSKKSVTLELPAGIFPIDIEKVNGEIFISMTQQKPKFLREYEAKEVADLFSLDVSDFLEGFPIQTVSVGTPQLMVPLQNLDSVKKVIGQTQKFLEFKRKGDFFSVHLFTLEGYTSAGDVYSRHFCAPPDIWEDPFTGSATGGMGAYLWNYGLMKKESFSAEQGHIMDRPGKAFVELIGTKEDIEGIKISGPAVVVMEGKIKVN